MIDNTRHRRRTARLLAETVLVFALIAAATLWADAGTASWSAAVIPILLFAQGIWIDRLYIVAHEGVHGKLLPFHRVVNDIVTSLLLLPIAAPLTIYRKIHFFHHGSNRRDVMTAALDSFSIKGNITSVRRLYYRAVWIFYVFMGGFFLHSLVTILLFLLVPTRTLRKIDPVFNGWRPSMRLRAWGEFAFGLGLHGTIAATLGFDQWLLLLGWPLVAFAWVWSLLLYIYHYDTSVGTEVRYNVRSLPRHPFASWLFLNFNEHATHHYDPSIPWHLLPEHRRPLPERFASNENVRSIAGAILQQLRGPRLVIGKPMQEGERQ